MEENRLVKLQGYSNLGSMTRLTFDNLMIEGRSSELSNQERFIMAYRAALAYAQNPQGWLVFMGPSGCGKTHLAAAIANQRIQGGQPAFFISVSDLLDHLRSTFSPSSDVSYDDLFDQVLSAPLLVLDDLGIQASTAWAEEKLFQIINHRFNMQLPTIVNLAAGMTLEDLEERWRTRLTAPHLSQAFILEEQMPSVPDQSGDLESALMKDMTFESFDPRRLDLPSVQRQNLEEAFRLAKDFARSPDGWLVFQGEYGCGKTHLAAAIANYRKRDGKTVCFRTVPDLLDHLRSTFDPESKVKYDEVFETVKVTPLLILDDFGEHNTTPWAQEKLY
ncbi:MAG: ATP-binding protein, partial [Chloroflexi bacterium]|nr:ATP-binding protein [Chloroflexota bacterium]